jgi:ABC-type protease/lipase transport system fused ATPase/permease subunit
MDRPILRNINFQIEPGAILGVIGPSGSGKSTLCRLLVGSWPPTVGHVRMDGADIGRWDRNEIGKHLGYLSQSVELFGGSVRENIARLGEAKDEEIIAAAKLAGCHELVQHLPNEYETNIGEGGAFLSGGQRQRIGLARAVFRKPRLLVLDEPNSNLDVEGKQRLLTALVEMKRAGAAIVLVTHETMLLSAADHIMILRDGVVEKIGRRNEFEKAVADMQKKQAAAAVESRRPKTDAPAE